MFLITAFAFIMANPPDFKLWQVLFRMASTRLRFNMGFWGFTFPLGVFTSGTVALSNAIPSAFFAYLSLVQLAALVSSTHPSMLDLRSHCPELCPKHLLLRGHVMF